MTKLKDVKSLVKFYQKAFEEASYTYCDRPNKAKQKRRDRDLNIYLTVLRACFESAEKIKSSHDYTEEILVPLMGDECLACNNIITSLSLSDNVLDIEKIENTKLEMYAYVNTVSMIDQLKGSEKQKFVKYAEKLMNEQIEIHDWESERYEQSIYDEFVNEIRHLKNTEFVDDQSEVKTFKLDLSTFELALTDALNLKAGINKCQIDNERIKKLIDEKLNNGVKVNSELYKKAFEKSYFLSGVAISDLIDIINDKIKLDKKGRQITKGSHK